MSRISNSKLDLFELCGLKYKFRYVDNLKADVTNSPLLYGVAVDLAINYILESLRDKKEFSKDKAVEIFLESMSQWEGQNRLDFFKNELPENMRDKYDQYDRDVQEQVWDNLCKRGLSSIDTYINDVLPLFDEVLSVQNTIEIKNEDGDVFVGIVDFIVKLKDGRTVLMDNKTASTKYPKNKVVKSQQLSLYLDQFPDIKYAGYIVLLKNPEEGKPKYQVLIDEIPEETIADSYKRLEAALKAIKEEKFEPNYKSCMAFGKSCEYTALCKYNNDEGLISTRKKEVDKTNKQ